MAQRFYRKAAGDPLTCETALPEGTRIEIWQPSRAGRVPAALDTPVNRIWARFDRFGLFANRNFAVVAVLRGDELLHKLIVTPRWYRFPFMADDDLQLGGLWTAPAERGRGLARAAMAAAHDHFGTRYGHMWYVVDDTNIASCRLVEACGYTLFGSGVRTAPMGVRALGRFVITAPA